MRNKLPTRQLSKFFVRKQIERVGLGGFENKQKNALLWKWRYIYKIVEMMS